MEPTPESSAPVPPPDAQASQFPEPNYGKFRSSKIGQLPKTIRDKLNLLLLDGVPHAEIPAQLGAIAKEITANNVDKWATGAHKLWLAEFNRLQETRVKQEVAMDLACPDGGSRIHEATLQLAATAISDMVRDLDLSDFKDMLRTDPAKLIPFLNALATISNAELKCERHRYGLAASASEEHPAQPAAKPGLTPATRQTMEHELSLM